jgi:hypothetical protein
VKLAFCCDVAGSAPPGQGARLGLTNWSGLAGYTSFTFFNGKLRTGLPVAA